jgi:hypothetical protein
MQTLLTGDFRDCNGRIYRLIAEIAIDLSDGSYLIRREFTIRVWEVIN